MTPEPADGPREQLDAFSVETPRRGPPPPEVARAGRDPANRIGRYIVIEEVGRGGFATVYRAWDPALGRIVALKVLRSDDSEDVARFEREARTAGRLSHPNVVPIHDVGTERGRVFIAMEFVDGAPLSRAPLTLRRKLEALRDAAWAVAEAHAQGVLHRDIKPDNILLGLNGRVFVADFGLAREVREGSTMTLPGDILGTPAYMSPEQARGRTEEVDALSDVYALGSTLYFVLAGRPPFAGDSGMDVVLGVLQRDPPPLRPRVHADLETVCFKAMDKERSRRYASARAFAEDLQRFLDGEPILARPVRWPTRILRRARRNRPAAALAVALAAAMVTGLVFGAGRILAEQRRERARAAAFPHFEEGRRAMDGVRRELRRPYRVDVVSLRPALDEAIASFGRAVAADPTFADAWVERGRAHALREDAAAAEADLTRAIELNPRLARALIARGNLRLEAILLTSRRPAGVLEDFRAAMTAGGADPIEIEYARAAIAFGEDRLEAAEAICRSILQSHPRDEHARLLLGDALARQERHEEAVQQYVEAIRHWTNHFEAYFHAGIALDSAGRQEEAIDYYGWALECNSRDVDTLNNRGFAHYRRRAYAAALADFDAAFALNPNDAVVLQNRGATHEEMGDLEAARADYERSAALNPSDPDTWEYLAGVYEAVGRTREAAEARRRARGER